jgi:group II intron reverse transcriptase/maturase
VWQQVVQLELFRETADSPKGDVARPVAGLPATAMSAVPKTPNTTRRARPAMTMEEVANEDNLREAFKRVASNKGAPGPDRQSIEEVARHLDRLLPALSRQLIDGSHVPGQVRRVWIPKPGGGERGLGIPNVVDRLVQQAVYQVLSPHYEPTFHASSHGFRPGRSCHTAITEARQHVLDGFVVVVDLDLEKFFDRVHHERLLARLAVRIRDERVTRLIRRMLKAKVIMPDGVVVSSEEGTPQGGPLSPLLSNIVLDELDRELSQRGHRFVRYADDCNIYVRSERAGQRVMDGVVRFIERKLRLKVNRTKSAVARPQDRHFVGFRLKPRWGLGGVRDVEIRLSKRSLERVATELRELTPRNWGRSLETCLVRVTEYVRGWIGFFAIVSPTERTTLHELDGHLRRRLRALVLKQWKRKRTIVRRLIRLGARPKRTYGEVFCSRSWWALSRTSATHRGLCTAYFAERGLVSIEDEWDRLRPKIVIAQQLQLALDSPSKSRM